VAQGITDKDGARRLHFFGDRAIERDGQGRDPRFLDCPLDQPHGLIAIPSGGCEKNGPDAVLFQFGRYGRSRLFEQFRQMSAFDVPHE
jgi:hypothetical protein